MNTQRIVEAFEEHGITKHGARMALPIITKGLKLLEANGWCQWVAWANDEYSKKVGFPDWRKGLRKDRFCAIGAITEVAGRKSVALRTANHALDAVVRMRDTSGDISGHLDIVGYNDTYGRTKKQVLSMFRHTIDAIKQFVKAN